MRRTDYSGIAPRYDKNPIRTSLAREPIIGTLLESHGSLAVLDLACGTGNFISAQSKEYHGRSIAWYGCDKSADMLGVAEKKIPFAKLSRSDAASLPYPDESFDLVTCTFAFHHFEDRRRCIAEIRRTLRSTGVFLMKNISPRHMPQWWVFHYFPSTYGIDTERHWDTERLFSEFDGGGFVDVEIRTELTLRHNDLSEQLAEAENRDNSLFTLIDEEEYREGLDRMAADLRTGIKVRGELALLRLTARKP